MAVIEVILREGMQKLGYIQVDNKGNPFYNYKREQATSMTIQQAIKLVDKLSMQYLFKIHRDKRVDYEDYINSHYIIV